MNRRNASGGPGLNVGSASIVMIFAVLCLTVFAVLSLLTARSELALAVRAADSVTDYYAADAHAVAIYDALAAGTDPAAGTDAEIHIPAPGHYSYTVPVDENQGLFVLLAQDGDSLQIRQWYVYMTGEWNPDNSLNLFTMDNTVDIFTPDNDPITGLG